MRLNPSAALLLVGLVAPVTADAQDSPATIGGQWFLSYRIGESGGADVNLFGIDRGYINIRHRLSDRWSGRITPDVTRDRDGDGEGDAKVRLKYAYANYEFGDLAVFTNPHVELGLVHRPWLDYEEHLNRYRVQGTMFLERNRLFNSADFGVTLFSLIGGLVDEEYRTNVSSAYPGRYGSFAIGIYNGGGYHALERNTNKALEGRISLRPLPGLAPGLQLTYLGIYGNGNQQTDTDWRANNVFVSWESRHLVMAGQRYWGRGNSGGDVVDAAGDAVRQDGFSVFAEGRAREPDLSVIGRYDFFDDTPAADGGESERIIVGVAYHIKGHSKILLDYDVQSRDGFGSAAVRLLKLAIEYGF